jgi:hypothetical protein
LAAKLKIEKGGMKLKKKSFQIKFGCGGHLGRSSEMLDTILEEDHTRITSAKLG